VNAIARDGDRLWVGTYDHGLAVLEKGAWKTVSGDGLDDRINAIATQTIGGKTRVWVGTTRGLVRIDGATRTVLDAANGLPSNDVHSLAAISGGKLLVGTSKGAAIVDGSDVTLLGKKQGLKIGAAWSVAEGPGGSLLVGANTGLYVRAKGAKKWERLSVLGGQLADDWVTAISVNGDDVFVGTYAGGVAKLTFPKKTGDAIVAEQLGGGYVNLAGLHVVGTTLYAATMDGLLVRALDDAAWRKPAKASLGVDVTGVALAPGGGLWVASRRGLVRAQI
jgi:ligand-binding sensor domain-containing protein